MEHRFYTVLRVLFSIITVTFLIFSGNHMKRDGNKPST